MVECIFDSLLIYSLHKCETLGSYFLRVLLTQHKQGGQTYVNFVAVVPGSKVTNVAGKSGSAAGFRGFQFSHSHTSQGPSSRLDLLVGFSGYTLVWGEVIDSLYEA